MEPDKDYPGSDIHIASNIASWQDCADLCYQTDQAPAVLHGNMTKQMQSSTKRTIQLIFSNCNLQHKYFNVDKKSNAEIFALAIAGKLIRMAGVASARCGRGLARAWTGRRLDSTAGSRRGRGARWGSCRGSCQGPSVKMNRNIAMYLCFHVFVKLKKN